MERIVPVGKEFVSIRKLGSAVMNNAEDLIASSVGSHVCDCDADLVSHRHLEVTVTDVTPEPRAKSKRKAKK